MSNLCRLGIALLVIGALRHLPQDRLAAQDTKEKSDASAKLPVPAKAEGEPRKFKRRDNSTPEELREQLKDAVEFGFNQIDAKVIYTKIEKLNQEKGLPLAEIGPWHYYYVARSSKNPEMFSLPWCLASKAQIGKEPAERLDVLSIDLRSCMRLAVPATEKSPDPDKLAQSLTNPKWKKREAVPTLVQMLQVENTSIRMMMIDLLAKIDGKDATVALAQRALFDLDPEVREKAVEVLAKRPPTEFQHLLLDALRWPWPPVADHAAEAIAMLQLKDMAPKLVELLKEPHPMLPVAPLEPEVQYPGIQIALKKNDKPSYVVRELVRINHLCNCTLCHALSGSKDDLVRGRIPQPGEAPPVAYYQAATGLFVRADITYLRQDFSVVQPVTNAGTWSGQQRYDYLLRSRKVPEADTKKILGFLKKENLLNNYPQRDAVLFALKEITGKDMTLATDSPPSPTPPPKKASPDNPPRPTTDLLPKPVENKTVTITRAGDLLLAPGSKQLLRKVIVAKDTLLLGEPGGKAGKSVESFTTFHVLQPRDPKADQNGWLQVAESDGKPLGWIHKDAICDWNTRCVLQPNPQQTVTVYSDSDLKQPLAVVLGAASELRTFALIQGTVAKPNADIFYKVALFPFPKQKKALLGAGWTVGKNDKDGEIASVTVMMTMDEAEQLKNNLHYLHGEFTRLTYLGRGRADAAKLFKALQSALVLAISGQEIRKETKFMELIADLPVRTKTLTLTQQDLQAMTEPDFNTWLVNIASSRDRLGTLLKQEREWVPINGDEKIAFIRVSDLP